MGIRTNGTYDGVITNGHSLILVAPASAVRDWKKPTVTELSSAEVIDGTYEFKTFDHAPSNDEIDDDRVTIPQSLKYDGGKTDTLSATIIFGNDNATLDKALKVGEQYVIYVRDAVPHDEPLAADQLVDAHPVRFDRKPTGDRARNAVFTRTLTARYWAEMLEGVAVVSGGSISQ